MEKNPKNFSYDAKKINNVILFDVWILLSKFTLTNECYISSTDRDGLDVSEFILIFTQVQKLVFQHPPQIPRTQNYN